MKKYGIYLSLVLIPVLLLWGCSKAPEETLPPETLPVTVPTTAPTEETEPPFDQEANTFLLTFAGDCTLGSDRMFYGAIHSFLDLVGEDYEYPFRNVAEYFRNDDFTMVNLEGVLLDQGFSNKKGFAFRGPVAFTNILTSSGVEAVTIANNHSMDFGWEGYNSTKDALTQADVTFVEKQQTALFTTNRGLTIGLLATNFVVDPELIGQQVTDLRDAGAELIIMAIHWGNEGYYHPIPEQVDQAKAMIDLGVDIVYGSHPHVLQRIEEYNGGIIYFSLGNFSFGGHQWPEDLDSVVLQQKVLRDEDGTIRLGELTRIPVCCSSAPPANNFQPTPYPVDSEEYNRVLSKLDDTFTGPNLKLKY